MITSTFDPRQYRKRRLLLFELRMKYAEQAINGKVNNSFLQLVLHHNGHNRKIMSYFRQTNFIRTYTANLQVVPDGVERIQQYGADAGP